MSVERLGSGEQGLVVVEVDVSGFDHMRAYRGKVFVLSCKALALVIHNLDKARKRHLANDLGTLDALCNRLQPLLYRFHACQALCPEAVRIHQIRRAMYTDYHLGSLLQDGKTLDFGIAIVQCRLDQYAHAEEDVFAASVEADHGGLQLRSV